MTWQQSFFAKKSARHTGISFKMFINYNSLLWVLQIPIQIWPFCPIWAKWTLTCSLHFPFASFKDCRNIEWIYKIFCVIMLEPSSVGLPENNEIESLISFTKLYKQKFHFKCCHHLGIAEGVCDCWDFCLLLLYTMILSLHSVVHLAPCKHLQWFACCHPDYSLFYFQMDISDLKSL